MSQAMTIRKLMIFLASMLRRIVQQDFIYKTEYDFHSQHFGLTDHLQRWSLEVAKYITLFFSRWKSLTFIGGILGE